ncbi:MAG: aldolase/citrate lyase family protein [Pseudomonadota bacterium]
MAPSHPLSLKTRLAECDGGPVYVVWCQMPGEGQAAAMVRAGLSGVVADMQHGFFSYDEMRLVVQATGRAGGVPMMRPPLDDVGMAARALDAGASVIIAPMINTVGDAARLVDASRYPPLASRSFGPAQALDLWQLDGQSYLSAGNDLTCVLAMVETAEAISNLDDILGVDGIDGVFVGPYDLSINLSGGKVGGAADPDVVDALPKVVACARKHGKISGIYASGAAQAKGFADLGFNLISLISDAGLIAAGAGAVLEDV